MTWFLLRKPSPSNQCLTIAFFQKYPRYNASNIFPKRIALPPKYYRQLPVSWAKMHFLTIRGIYLLILSWGLKLSEVSFKKAHINYESNCSSGICGGFPPHLILCRNKCTHTFLFHLLCYWFLLCIRKSRLPTVDYQKRNKISELNFIWRIILYLPNTLKSISFRSGRQQRTAYTVFSFSTSYKILEVSQYWKASNCSCRVLDLMWCLTTLLVPWTLWFFSEKMTN